MSRDGWTPEAARLVQDRYAESQPGLPLSRGGLTRQSVARSSPPLIADWYELTIPGDPVAKGRARFRVVAVKGKAPFVQPYTPKETQEAEARIKAAWEAAGGPYLGGRLELEILFFQIPQKNRAPRHEDWDNLAKLVCDALNKVAFGDDRQITRAVVEKLEDALNPRTVIRLRTRE